MLGRLFSKSLLAVIKLVTVEIAGNKSILRTCFIFMVVKKLESLFILFLLLNI